MPLPLSVSNQIEKKDTKGVASAGLEKKRR
jgi:hypothetical protein